MANNSKSEHWHQSTFFDVIRKLDHPATEVTFAVPNGFLRTKSMRLRAWKEGMLSGVADVVVPYPARPRGRAPGAHGLFIEFKVVPNTLSAAQNAFRRRVEALGYVYAVAYSWQEALGAWCEHVGVEIER